MTATGVYALEDRGDDRVVTLFYRPWDGEEQRELFTTSDLGRYLKGTALTGQMDIQSFALRPAGRRRAVTQDPVHSTRLGGARLA